MKCFLFFTCVLGLCPPDQCTTAPSFTCTASAPENPCAECGWTGWIPAGGTCVAGLPPAPRSCSSSGIACTLFDGQCLSSQHGQRCRECSYRGFLSFSDDVGMECTCYIPGDDPHRACFPRLQPNATGSLDLEMEYTRVWCESHQSPELGCFKNVTHVTRYGDPYPDVPRECCTPAHGPPPGQLVEIECNTYGGFDPNEPFAIGAFRTCSGHGRWNAARYECECDPEWSAVHVMDGIYSCKDCFGFYGPRPPLDAPMEETTVAFCTRLETPDATGVLRECGGGGVYENGACTCMTGWVAQPVTQVFTRILGSGERRTETVDISTCTVCLDGCTSTVVPVETFMPAPAPATCLACPSFGQTAITSTAFLNTSTLVFGGDDCCSLLGGVRATGGSCIETEMGRRHAGGKMCSLLHGCRAYFIHLEPGPTWVYKFTDSSTFTLVFSALSESGAVCPPTPSPVPPTTKFPTIP